MSRLRLLCGAVWLASVLLSATAVSARTGPPPHSFVAHVDDVATVESVFMPAVDVDRYLREDEESPSGPVRFAAPIEVTLDIHSSGTWEDLLGGGKVWRLRVISLGATNLSVAFIPFFVPPGTTLHLYTPDRSYVEGPFGAGDNIPERELWTPIIPGEEVVIELFVPSGAAFEPELTIGRVHHGYREFGGPPVTGCQDPCNVDVICPEGDPWRDEIRSAAVYQVGGVWTCSGTLLNSWTAVPPPYFLVATHCGVTDANDHTVTVYWNYQSPTCGQHGGGSLVHNQTGSTFCAARAQTDFTLIRLSATPDPSFDVHYSGWNALGATPPEATGIHHPCTSEKAICFNDDPVLTTSLGEYETPGDGTMLLVDDWEWGMAEPGSSGSGLWDQQHRLVGQCRGGQLPAVCQNPLGVWYGKFAVSWGAGSSPATRLRDWLDPNGISGLLCDGNDGGCAFTLLHSGTSVEATGTPRNYRFGQADIYWTAVGVRPAAGDDWDIRFYDDFAQNPDCVTGLRASSVASTGVDFVVGDYNHCPVETEYAKVNRYSGTQPATVEWDSGPDRLVVNGPYLQRTTGPSDVLEIWDVFLEAGRTYRFEFVHFGAAQAKMLLFRNPAASPYWAGRSSRIFEAGADHDYVPPASDWYGVVVVNDNGADGAYRIGVRTCFTPLVLASGVSVNTPPIFGYHQYTQSQIYWSAVGNRGANGSDWDIRLYRSGSGEAPECFSQPLAASVGVAGVVDFVIGDFNHNALGTYYAFGNNFSNDTNGAVTEWDDGANQIVVGAPPVERTTGGSDVLEVWDVFLTQGETYDLYFDRSGSADTKLLLFKSQGGEYWVGRGFEEIQTTALHTPYLARTSDWYGLIVVNDNGGEGSYSVGVQPQTSAVDSGSEYSLERTELLPPAPNPASGATQILVRVADRESFGLQIVDVAGRSVAEWTIADPAPGIRSIPWDGRDFQGRKAPAGVYWVRMSAGSRELGRERFVMIR